MAGLSSPGIGSGLDINTLVSKLMSIEQQPLTKLDTEEAKYQTKISALGTLKGAISSLQSAVSTLNSQSKYSAKTVSSADSTVLTGSASTLASKGSYKVVVSQLAQSQNLSSDGFAASTTTVGSGTLTIQFGTLTGGAFNLNPDKGTHTITIGSSANTLTGIADAINAAAIGVSASIVNDGSTNGYRLVLTSEDTGAANEMRITATSDTGDLSVFEFDPTAASSAMTENQAAQDAQLTVNGLAVSKASNTITDVIHGVTLNVLKVSDGTPPSTATTLTVAKDDAGTQTAVQAFVDAYNEAAKALADASSYDATTKQAGPLQGDFAVLTMQRQLRAMLNTPLSSPGGGLTSLSDIGVSFQKDASLTLDASKLAKVLADSTKDVSTLFAAVGKATDSLVSVAASTSSTKPGSYEVRITTAAARGYLIGSSAAAASTTIVASTNDALNVVIDGTSAAVTLTAGSYTPTQLAAEVQSRINGAAALTDAGVAVSVGFNGTRGTAVGSTASGLVIGAGNKTLQISVDGTVATADITLTEGTYTAASLAVEIQSKINADADLVAASKSVVVSVSNGILTISSNSYGVNGLVTSSVDLTGGTGLLYMFGTPTETAGTGDGKMLITSNRYGSASNVAVAGSSASDLLGAAPYTETVGIDVVGTIGGAEASGSGQYLTGTGNAAGLKLLIDGTTTGDRGSVNFSRGYAYQLNALTSSFLDSTGIFAARTDGINASIKDIDKRRTALQNRLVDIEARYRAQFNALDSLIASMQSTQSYLTQQLSSLSALANYTVTGGKG